MARSTFRRINRGKWHSYTDQGRKVQGVTTIINQGVPKPALTQWAARVTAEEAVHYFPTLNQLIEEMGEEAVVELLKGAPNRDRDKAANRGTEVHRFSEELAHQKEVEVPEELLGHVDAYLLFRDEWKPTEEYIELVVGNRRHGYGGTLDRIAALRGMGTVLYDVKTNRSGPFGEVALQLAAYRFAEFFLDEAGREHPMVPVDSCAVLWLRADGYDLIPVEAGLKEFRSFLNAKEVAEFCARKDLLGDALAAPQLEVITSEAS